MGRSVAVLCSQLQHQLLKTIGTRPQTAAAIKRTFVCGNTRNRYPSPSFIHKESIRLLSTPRIVGPPPRLFDLIIQIRFDEVLKRVKSHPHEVAYPHPRRWTALHACVEYGAPIQVVEALVKSYPNALNLKDWRGQTPIDAALTDEIKQYLASVDVASLGGGAGGARSEKDASAATGSLADDVSASSHHLLQHVDKISEQALNLRHQCQNLEDEIRMLREALTKRRD
mmetsp:Transcript_2346/g.6823  ORF Transcript_2346/g.6823 Transcript_2346/m.6823 type:complete len:227 (+) Transcript_2346:153-833(+)